LLKIKEDPMCLLCGEEYDTSLHLGRCSAVFGKRRKQFGKHFLVSSELRQDWSMTLKFAKKKLKRF